MDREDSMKWSQEEAFSKRVAAARSNLPNSSEEESRRGQAADAGTGTGSGAGTGGSAAAGTGGTAGGVLGTGDDRLKGAAGKLDALVIVNRPRFDGGGSDGRLLTRQARLPACHMTAPAAHVSSSRSSAAERVM